MHKDGQDVTSWTVGRAGGKAVLAGDRGWTILFAVLCLLSHEGGGGVWWWLRNWVVIVIAIVVDCPLCWDRKEKKKPRGGIVPVLLHRESLLHAILLRCENKTYDGLDSACCLRGGV